MLNSLFCVTIGGLAFIWTVTLIVKPFLALRTLRYYPKTHPSAVPHYGFWTNLFQLWFALFIPANVSFYMLMSALSTTAAHYLLWPFVMFAILGGIALMAYFFSRLWHEEKHAPVIRQLEMNGMRHENCRMVAMEQ